MLLASVAGAFVGGLFGFVVAVYRSRSARQTKLMELEFDMYWGFIRRTQVLMERFEPENLGAAQASDLSEVKLAKRRLMKDLILFSGHKEAVEAFKDFSVAFDQFLDALQNGPEIPDHGIPKPLGERWYDAARKLTTFQIAVREALKEGT